MAFLDELAGHGDRVRLHPQDEAGLLPLAEFLGEPRDDTRIYCCGPGPLLDAVEAVCAHWPRHALRTERFVATEHGPAVHEGPFTVELARKLVIGHAEQRTDYRQHFGRVAQDLWPKRQYVPLVVGFPDLAAQIQRRADEARER